MPEIWVAGMPGEYGGSVTELDHLAELLLANGVKVNFVPMPEASPDSIAWVASRGFAVRNYFDGIFAGKVVLSFCNSAFLARLQRIVYYGRPRAIVWFSCIVDLFPLEPILHEVGWIDYFGFVSEYQRRCIEPELSRYRPMRILDYRPYLELSRYRWKPRDDPSSFHMGRVSRDDALKYPGDMWITFDNVRVPPSVTKRVFILGYGKAAAAKTGPPPSHLETTVWPPQAVPISELYSNLDVLMYRTGGWRESYCRVLVEAYAHGVVPVVQRDYAFPELVKHGETGFLADDSREMTEFASWLAHHPRSRLEMAEKGRHYLETTLVDPQASLRGLLQLVTA